MGDFVVVREHPSLILFVDQLQRKNAEALSFYPRQVFEREAERVRIFMGLLNGQPCGYLYAGSGQGGVVRCHQVCVEYEARRRLYGAGIVAVMEAYAEEMRANRITLRCGFDLDANQFWSELGYKVMDVVDGGIRRQRRINVWSKFLQVPLFLPDWMTPEEGKTDASLWRTNKQAGTITQFARGKKLRDYRAIVQAAKP